MTESAPAKIGIVTVSDRASRGEYEDRGGPAVHEFLANVLTSPWEALARITAQQRETSRDPRVALLERIGELGDAANAEEIRPYLADFDPRIAQLAAETLLAWTGDPSTPSPRPLAPQPFPSIDELLELERSVARIHLRVGGIVEIELYPFEAPTNVTRFARQARQGYFEGLTFHRVVPNFVVQGGSPGASEYVGDGPYSRDEVDDLGHGCGRRGARRRYDRTRHDPARDARTRAGSGVTRILSGRLKSFAEGAATGACGLCGTPGRSSAPCYRLSP